MGYAPCIMLNWSNFVGLVLERGDKDGQCQSWRRSVFCLVR
jgi:hypothetical protein